MSSDRLTFGVLPVLAALMGACVLGPEPNVARRVADGEYCVSQDSAASRRLRRGPEGETVAAGAAAARGYSPRSLETARAIGAIAEVERLAQAQARNAPDAEIASLRARLSDAIALATLDIASTVSHIQCEEGRAGQIATDLRDAEQRQTRTLTAYSLVVSAVSAIGAGVLTLTNKSDPTPPSIVGISGGTAGAAFGLATLRVHRSTSFHHTRNILAEMWNGGEHPDFPEVVWTYLTQSQFTKTRDATLREVLVLFWKESGRLGDDATQPSAERVALYFGAGGTYDADGLDDRSDMLSEVREAVSLMNQDLQDLASEAADR